ncbi:UDP-galactopyranose mutase [Lacticaseibacillus chiayiensis]|uniref:UDP-galactopyranose mutase n=1 Tax=Lacticaseibacillus chiayiensis TaxID=2100821 RepID=A0A4Q1TPE4_9LACO|nr:UDP-galactopyranose mutase [Lacticaseibacillus chiayiensis]RXT20492.1 UDP-galactopyranose mutase [Lacticaseibacillus chiayiensis]UYN57429.1 UDP-galactopyranose mutase [Lacticaseibacillus chiayiensis]
MKILVVGAGLFGAVCAHELAKKGHHITVIEKRDHVAGNVYTRDIAGIQVHEYGAHIFHTSNPVVWDYVRQFAHFNRFTNQVIANYRNTLYNLPFNMNTFYQMWGTTTPKAAEAKINSQRSRLHEKNPSNLEEQAISLVGTDIYHKLIEGYTTKQWGRAPKDLPAFIIRRLPVRMTFDNNYFNDRYQGIPVGGYTQIVEKMLDVSHITTHLKTNFFSAKEDFLQHYDHIIFTGLIDKFFDYRFGELAYRSLRFDTKLLDVPNFQGNAVMNYTDASVPFTRIIEHKWFEFGHGNPNQTVITHEYPQPWSRDVEPYYPVNDITNNHLFSRYRQYAEQSVPNVTFGGRLGLYRYYNMDQVIAAALQFVTKSPLF